MTTVKQLYTLASKMGLVHGEDDAFHQIVHAVADRALHRADIRGVSLAECLSHKQKMIYDLVGEDIYVELVGKFGGGCIFLCSRHTLHNAQWKATICSKFDGTNFEGLMRKYHVSKQFLSELLKK